jgi:hypothetical protein
MSDEALRTRSLDIERSEQPEPGRSTMTTESRTNSGLKGSYWNEKGA